MCGFGGGCMWKAESEGISYEAGHLPIMAQMTLTPPSPPQPPWAGSSCDIREGRRLLEPWTLLPRGREGTI